MGSIAERLKALSSRTEAGEVVEIEPGFKILLREPSWGEQASARVPAEHAEDPARLTFYGVSGMVRDPKTGKRVFLPTDEGFEAFSKLSAAVGQRIVGLCNRYLAAPAVEPDPSPAKKKAARSRRKSARRS